MLRLLRIPNNDFVHLHFRQQSQIHRLDVDVGTRDKGAMSQLLGAAEPRPLDRPAACPQCPPLQQGKQRALRLSRPPFSSRRRLNNKHATLRIPFLHYFLQTILHPGWPIIPPPQRRSREAHKAGQIHDKAHHIRRKDDQDSELDKELRGNVSTSKMQPTKQHCAGS